jgi:DNA-binding Xre family transcriptional regulator/SepF-like predicted cell division protein (DUF552 family)
MQNNLRKIRLARGIKSNKKFASMINTSPQNLFYMETKGQAITPEKAQKICKILNCTLNDLYDENLDLSNLQNMKEEDNIIDVKFFDNLLNNKFSNRSDFDSFVKDYRNFETHNYSKKMFKKINKISIDENSLISFLMFGNYMSSFILNGAILIADIENTIFTDNQVYLVNENSELKIRRIKQPDPNIDQYQVASDKEDDIDSKKHFKRFEELQKIIYAKIILTIK